MPARTFGLISFLGAGVGAGPEVPDRRIAPAAAEAPPQMMAAAERAGRAEGSGWHPAVAAVRRLGEIWLAAPVIALLAVRIVSRAQPCPDLPATTIQGAAEANVVAPPSMNARIALGDERVRELRASGADMDWD